MIKLILADMDGTLLADRAGVPPETFELIEALAEYGVLFGTASGRRGGVLHEMFAPVADKMDFIASNGMEVFAGGECIFRRDFDIDNMAELGRFIAQYDHLHLTTGNDDVTWVYDEPEKFAGFVARHTWTNYTPGPIPPDGKSCCGVVICMDPDRFVESADMLIREFGDRYSFGRTGSGVAIDFTEADVSKATALDVLMEHYGITRDEVLMYGDAMNDYALMEHAGHAVCVANALPEIMEISERVIESNIEHGVQKDMARILADLEAGGDGLIDFGARS
ncbi:MAG: HAD family phosphatase [Atopobiaceae bacterium]|nr:HAD family phosphatase [Atopobiaceae bacterium]